MGQGELFKAIRVEGPQDLKIFWRTTGLDASPPAETGRAENPISATCFP